MTTLKYNLFAVKKLNSLTILLCLVCAFTANLHAADTVSLWSRGDHCYLVSGNASPIWPEIPADAMSAGKYLELTIEMPAGFEISAHGQSTDFAMQPVPLIVPLSMNSTLQNDSIVYQIYLPVPPTTGVPRVALLVNPHENQGTYNMTIGLKTIDGSITWSDLNAEMRVLPPLKKKRPERMQIALYDYASYTNSDFKTGIVNTFADSGINYLHNMKYFASTDTVAQRLRADGVKSGWIWFWSKYARDITNTYPQAKCLDSAGLPLYDSLCYTWCIQNKQLVIDLLADFIDQSNTPIRYDCIINDNEETSLTDAGAAVGDLYTPLTLEEFRTHAGISPSVVLTPAVIAADYPDQWVDFRCWQCAEMAEILGKAIKQYNPEMLYGLYSGYKYTGAYTGFTKRHYSIDWDLIGQIPELDFGNAGYYGLAYVQSTAAALGDKSFMHGEMFIEHFLANYPTMPTADQFFYRLLRSILYAGGKGGVGVWYAQVLDGAAISGISRTAYVAEKIEDFFFDGVRCDDELSVTGNYYSNEIYAYRIGQNKRMVTLINNSSYAKSYTLTWDQLPTGAATMEIQSSAYTTDPYVMTGTLASNTAAVYITSATPEKCGDIGTIYYDADLNKDCYINFSDFAIMASQWLK